MSLMNAVTKMAIGFAVAKGMDAVQKNGGLGSLMEGLTGSGGQGGTRQAGTTGSAGGIGDILSQVSGGGQGASGGLGGLLNTLTGGGAPGGASAGGLGGLSSMLGGLAAARGGAAGGGLEALLRQDNPTEEPSEDEIALLMLRAMTQAARADGDIDRSEKAKLLSMLEDGSPSDMAAVQKILDAPINASDLAADTPRGMETQVYTMSVNAIDPDNQAEAQYLHELAGNLGLDPQTCNQIHDSLGAPTIYR